MFQLIPNGNQLEAKQTVHSTIRLDPFQDCTAAVKTHLDTLESGAPVCIDATTGLRIWTNSTANGPRASLTLADGHLYIRNAEGDVTLAKVSSEGMSVQGRFKILEHEKSLGVTSPTLGNPLAP